MNPVIECPYCGGLIELDGLDEAAQGAEQGAEQFAADLPRTIDWDEFLLSRGYYAVTHTARRDQ